MAINMNQKPEEALNPLEFPDGEQLKQKISATHLRNELGGTARLCERGTAMASIGTYCGASCEASLETSAPLSGRRSVFSLAAASGLKKGAGLAASWGMELATLAL